MGINKVFINYKNGRLLANCCIYALGVKFFEAEAVIYYLT